jgi:hypothetical protein
MRLTPSFWKQDEKGAKRPAKKLDDTERLFANIRNLLNKLTLDNFDELSRKIIELFNTINKPEILTEAVSILHSKVKNQSHTTQYTLSTSPSSSTTTTTTNNQQHSTSLKLMSLRCLNRCLFFFISGIKGASVCFDVQ